MNSNLVKLLKEESDYFPKVLTKRYIRKNSFEEIYLSTIVRIKREGIWYNIHCVEASITPTTYLVEGIGNLFQSFLIQVYSIQKLFIINPKIVDREGNTLYDIDSLQIEEEMRLNTMLTEKLTRR